MCTVCRYFKEYPRIQGYFPYFEGKSLDELRDSDKLRSAGTTVLNAVTSIVENLDDPDTMVVLQNNTAERHTPRSVTFREYEVGRLSWPMI